MNAQEVTQLCRYIEAACPAQAMDEFTAEVWCDILPASITLAEARTAVVTIKQRQPYVDVSDVIAEVKRARAALPVNSVKALTDPDAYLQVRRAQDAADAACLARLRLRAGIGGREVFALPGSTSAPTGASS